MFTFLVLFAAFLIESIGTYVSVVGLSALFSANPVIILLAVSLDIGKVVTVSFLYRNWKDISWLMKSYMTIAAIVLMIITSVGAFGYLSAEFQKAIQGTNENAVIIQTMEDEQARLQARKEQIDNQIAQFPPEYVTGRRQAVEQFAPEVNRINERLAEIDQELPNLKLETIKKNVEVGPIIFIAEAFGTTPEQAVKYVILIIIFVFDPLAIALLIAGNFLIKNKELLKAKKEQEKIEARTTYPADAFVPPFRNPVPESIQEAAPQVAEEPVPEQEDTDERNGGAIAEMDGDEDDTDPEAHRIEYGGVTAEMDGDDISDLDLDVSSDEVRNAIEQLESPRPHLKEEKTDDREVITKEQLLSRRVKSQLEDLGVGADVFDSDVRPADSSIRSKYVE